MNDKSIFSAELTAIERAIDMCETVSKVMVCTDSLSTIQSLQQLYPKDPQVDRVKNMIHQHRVKIVLCWVPGHMGIIGNAKADKLARTALTINDIASTKLKVDKIKSIAKKLAHGAMLRRWEEKGSTMSSEDIPRRGVFKGGIKW